ncbi:hypothetical protein [Catellatospora sichuanensis]|uniref:hypothetical protein n=1 Tax=Catellatospora sichuanensis TaxID=1969805 RepID=UPI0011830940|nr:hypothetical protein [Catellatospora sichuanensis]
MEARPGTAAGILGTSLAVIGVIVIVAAFLMRRYGLLGADGLFVGGLMVVAGLLLRIEAAVARGAGRASSDAQRR